VKAIPETQLQRITEQLAFIAFEWRPVKCRYIRPDGGWLPTWRFSPFDRIEDALQVLEKTADDYKLHGNKHGHRGSIEVTVGTKTISASGEPKARLITTALAYALGLAS
jgi:hypothetical protein